MPDVLSRSSARQAESESVTSDGSAKTSDPSGAAEPPARTPEGEPPSATAPEGAWTGSVSRETGGSVNGAEFRSIPVDSIVPNPRQPRQEFDEEHMDELIHSIREIGMLQPVVVRPAGPDHYELVMGERRWRASKAADLQTVPAIVRMTKDDDLLRDALLENIHRSQLNPLEEAAAYRQLLDDFNCTQDELAERIGRSRPQISNTLRLMKLPPAVQRRVAAGVLSSGHARALLGLKSTEQMEQLAGRIVAEGLSVRATEEAVTLAQRSQGTEDLGRERAKSPRVRQLEEFSDALTDRLDTQVKITLGAKKGRIAIDFGSIDDLHRLMDMIGSRP
nr:ParB/RepB/Spo0J family partition protein [Nesterenkonia lutea]